MDEALKNKITFCLQMLIDGAIDIYDYITDEELLKRPRLMKETEINSHYSKVERPWQNLLENKNRTLFNLFKNVTHAIATLLSEINKIRNIILRNKAQFIPKPKNNINNLNLEKFSFVYY